MADIEVSIGSVAEIPKGLDKVAEATHNAVSKGMLSGISEIPKGIFHAIEDFKKANAIALREGDIFKGGSVTSLQRQVNKYVKQLKAVPLTAETQPELLKAALATRVYVNQTASMAREFGTPTAISLSTMSQEMVRNMVNETRGFPAAQVREQRRAQAAQEREQKRIDREEKRKQAEEAREQRRIEREEAKQQAALERERKRFEKEQAKERLKRAAIKDATKRMDVNSALYEEEGRAIISLAESGELTREEAEMRMSNLNAYRRRYFRAMRDAKRPLSEREKDEDIDRQNMHDIKESLKGINNNTSVMSEWLTGARGYIAAGAGGIAVGNYASNLVARYYANRQDPYTQLEVTAADMGQKAGGIIGAIVGGVIGTALAPVTGGLSIPVGAALAGGAGAWLGGTQKRALAAQYSSQQDAIEQRRWRALYGNRTNGWQFAKFVGATGFATEGDVETMMANANTFNAAAAFGGVSSSQYMALAMMPNYYNAMVSGASESEMLQAYQQDMDALGPGMGAYFSQMAGVPESIRALANSGTLGFALNDLGEAARLEASLGQHENAYLLDYYNRRREDVRAREDAWGMSAVGALLQTSLGALNVREWVGGRAEPSDRFTKRDIVININTDEAIRLENVYTDDQLLDAYIQYSAGSIA